MKAVCVNNKPIEGLKNTDLHLIEEGKNYEVVGERPTFQGGINYVLKWINNTGYSSRRFVPLSDLDETELVTEEFKEKHYVPA